METGKVCDAVQAEIPKECEEELEVSAKVLGDSLLSHYFWEEGVGPRKLSIIEHLKNQTWRAALCVIGADGLPSISDAGNVVRTHTTLKVSIRLPPSVNAEEGFEKLKAILTKDPPFGAKVEVTAAQLAKGWYAKGYPPKFKEELKNLSKQYFGEEYGSLAGGGSIPFVTILEKQYPKAIIIVTGAATTDCNGHAPNEFLELDYTKKFIIAMTQLMTNIE
jgi:acetylornithine deacetylase/succinyl-diaminopimelate desuccinylase-like protein